MNSVINLSWDYKELVQVSTCRWKEYMNKNKNKDITLPKVVGGDVIAQHFKEQTDRTSKESFIDYSVNLLPSYTTDEQLRMIRIYGHLLSMHTFKQNDLNRWRRMSEQDLFHSIWSTIIGIIFEDSTVVLTSNCMSADINMNHIPFFEGEKLKTRLRLNWLHYIIILKEVPSKLIFVPS
ncbi:hypothetical protein BDC45DRAFT_532627 [Circinella umbellata]|nr:hypothetical protein BDC45DRAFT_532627 [Circinella umbellata]